MTLRTYLAISAAVAVGATGLACGGSSADDVGSGAGAATLDPSSGAGATTSPPTPAPSPPSSTPAPIGAPPQPPALATCKASEDTIFACSSVENDSVALCASKDASATSGSIQLRVGSAGNPDVVVPGDDPGAPSYRDIGKGATLTFAGGGGAYVRFDAPEASLVVYTAIGEGFDESGLVVEKSQQVLTHFKCKDDPHSQLGPDFFQKTAMPKGDSSLDFALPTPDK